jgi:RsiW-degrading membrane proteinase PrsW (M82 family)
MGFLASLVIGFSSAFIFAIFVYWLDRYEKEPKFLLGIVFFWGAFIASAVAFVINTAFGVSIYALTGSQGAADISTGALSAPFIEELMKAAAVFGVYIFCRSEFDSILDGIVYASIVALGFAATENTYYIYHYGYLENGWSGLFSLTFIRIILVGWQHPFFTSFFGISLAISRFSRGAIKKIGVPFIGLSFSIFTHSLHNLMTNLVSGYSSFWVTTFFDWTGWIALLIFIVFTIAQERKLLKDSLWDEVKNGSITQTQYNIVTTHKGRFNARVKGLVKGELKSTNHFMQIASELGHKKHQIQKMGNEKENYKIADSLRAELVSLSQEISL